MALGAFGNLTPQDYETISKGFQSTNPELSLGGLSITGRDIGSSLFSAIAGSNPIGLVPSAVNLGQSYAAEQAAARAMGVEDPGFFDTVRGMVGESSFDAARAAADTNKDGVVSVNESRAFGIGSGLAASDVGVTEGFNFGSTTPSGLYSPETFNVTSAVNQFNTPTTMAPLQRTETPGAEKSSKQSRSNISNAANYDPDFAKEQEAKRAEEEKQSSGGGGGGGKYICTALHEMGDMDSQVFAYDLLYGQLVDPVVHSGYALWGIPLAEKVRKKGIVYRIVKPLALAWANQMSHELSGGEVGKTSITGHILMKYGEKICRQIGLRRVKWQLSM